MRYAGIKYNDTANAPGISVSIYLQGCPHRCRNCFNQETWDFDGGKELTEDIILDIFNNRINANGVKRKLSILGGEPLHPKNLDITFDLVLKAAKYEVPVYIWTGYTIEQLAERYDTKNIKCWNDMQNAFITGIILNNINCLIDGPFIEEEKDLTLKMRGSRNQRILYHDELIDKFNKLCYNIIRK